MATKKACIKCGSPMKKGWCVDETCPFSDSIRKREWLAHCKAVNTIEPWIPGKVRKAGVAHITEAEANRAKPIHVAGFNPPIPNMTNPKTAAKVKAFIKKKKADAKMKALKDLVKELKKDSKRKNAEIEAFKKQLHSREK